MAKANRSNAGKGKKTKSSKKTKNKEKTNKAVCHLCGKVFSKIANVNAHIEKVHKQLRWECPICEKKQVSRYSHIRHYKACHKGETSIDPEENARYSDDHFDEDLPEKAKVAIVEKLKDKNQALEILANEFRERLLNKLEENINLKARLGINAEMEKLEFNNLIGAEKLKEAEQAEVENSDDDDEYQNSTHYPVNSTENDSLKHIKESDPGAGGSGL